MEHFEVEPSQDIIDDDMDFSGKNEFKPHSKSKSAPKTKNPYMKSQTMFINGKAIVVNKNHMALNKREKANWLVHILFIR